MSGYGRGRQGSTGNGATPGLRGILTPPAAKKSGRGEWKPAANGLAKLWDEKIAKTAQAGRGQNPWGKFQEEQLAQHVNDKSDGKFRMKWHWAIMILLVTLAGVVLRFYRLSNQSLWTDEVSSIATARVPLSEIMDRSGAVNNCLPTYFLLLRAVLGDANRDIEFRARWLSALAGALSVPLLIGVVYRWRRQWGAALLAGLLLAVNPLHLWYSQEVRAYATMLFFGLLTLLAYELARRSRKPWWWVVYLLRRWGDRAAQDGLIFPGGLRAVAWMGGVAREGAPPRAGGACRRRWRWRWGCCCSSPTRRRRNMGAPVRSWRLVTPS